MPKLLIPCLVLSLLVCACAYTQKRGLLETRYVSTTRPAITVSATSLPLMGSEHLNLKLQDMGVIGGLPLDVWLTLYGEKEGPLLAVALVDLQPGWHWDANMQHSFSVDQFEEGFGGIRVFAQTHLSIPFKNPFRGEDEARDLSEKNDADRWIIRSYSARFNSDKTKLIIEYREKLPSAIQSLQHIPMGYDSYLKEFEERARKAVQLARTEEKPAELGYQTLPKMRTRFLDQHFFGTATPVFIWPDK